MTTDLLIRPAHLNDAPAINQLLSDVWFPTRSEAGWKWLLQDNPSQDGFPSGLIAEQADGDVIGFLGATVFDFAKGQEMLRGMTGHSFIARPGNGRASLQLIRKLLQQKAGFVSYTLNNNAISAPIFPKFNGRDLFNAQARQTLQWITNRPLYYSAGLRRRYHQLTGFNRARDGRERYTHIIPLHAASYHLPEHVELFEDFKSDGSRIDTFWSRLRETDNVYVSRQMQALTWRLSNPDQTHPPIFFTYDRGAGIEGWLIAFPSKESEIAAPILTIVDLVSLPEAASTAMPALLRGALSVAKGMKLMKAALPMINAEMLQHFGSLVGQDNISWGHTHAQGFFHPPYKYEDFESKWHLTPFDGDYSFCLRPLPPQMVKCL